MRGRTRRRSTSRASSRRRRSGPVPTSDRVRYDSGTRWEPIVGYSRAVRVGSSVHVSGTTATDARGRIVGVGDPYRQTQVALDNVVRALRALGSGPEEVIRTRIYVTDISRWREVGRAHGEMFRRTRPATSMVQVAALIAPEVLVEVEADAEIVARRMGPRGAQVPRSELAIRRKPRALTPRRPPRVRKRPRPRERRRR
ncbi:MAG: RidA family protein [Euryarchaeota archaeon]|nr:RidA family protein [Euryarchaeota archaeon]MDE1835451.1 RidA family protein [Euryarchaeota archaeon]MDE1879587.1 RidA family protein [Euryarchaeota archaeon]MDE2046307.1 RidA family protein [Thermoplasmata archaeon]